MRGPAFNGTWISSGFGSSAKTPEAARLGSFAHLHQLCLRAIHCDLELIGLARGASEFNLEDVVAIQGNIGPHSQSAPRAKRKSLHMNILRMLTRQPVGIHHHRHGGIANCQPADLSRRFQIAFHGGGRDKQQVGDVVEAAAGIVGGQEQRIIHLLGKRVQRQQVANGVFVFGAAQPVQQGQFADFDVRGRGPVERGFQPSGGGIVGSFIGAGHRGRRHGLGPQLLNHLFPHLGMRTNVLQLRNIQNEPTGLQLGVMADGAVFR